MTTEPHNPSAHCLSCGTELSSPEATCWACGRKKRPASDEVNAYQPPAPLPEESSSKYSLSMLFVVVTLLCICLGIGIIMPAAGIGLALLFVPALIRTSIAIGRKQRRGELLVFEDKFMLLLASVGVMLGLAVVTGITFYATCWAGFAAGMGITMAAGNTQPYAAPAHGIITGLIVGALAAIVVGIWLGWRWLPIERKTRAKKP
ncbi:MAG TPA: hypothetical protein VL096_03445 [Pirellulaceae bacterium]|nr:hypothetical protein [Pirellulaceae bacterium]